GLRVASTLAGDAELLLIPGYPLRFYARNGDRAVIARAATALAAQPWCHRVFVAPDYASESHDPRVVSRRTVATDHIRAPDLCVTVRHSDRPNQFGWPGQCPIDVTLPYVGNHGGLSPQERSCLAIFAGSMFRRDVSVATKTSIVDLMPTILAAMGLDLPATMASCPLPCRL